MAILGKITTFFDYSKQALFPTTKTRAVTDDEGVALNVLLDDKQKKHAARSVTLHVGAWSNNLQTVAIGEANGTNTIIVCSAPENMEDYANDGVYCLGQDDGKLTFSCTSTPSKDLVANIMIFN